MVLGEAQSFGQGVGFTLAQTQGEREALRDGDGSLMALTHRPLPEDALALPPAEHYELAKLLMDGLAPHNYRSDAEWCVILDRRSEDLPSGEVA